MRLDLYKTSDDSRKLNKNIIKQFSSQNINLKSQVGVTEPVIDLYVNQELTIEKLINECNYCYIDVFNRYYFINSFDILNNSIVRLNLSVDVLMSNREKINNLQCLVLRQEYVNNPYIADNLVKVRADRMTDVIKLDTVLTNQWADVSNCFILTTNGTISI